MGYVDICLLKLSGANVNLSIAFRLCLNEKTVLRQISADQETAIVLPLNVTQYSIWIHKNNLGVLLNTVKGDKGPQIDVLNTAKYDKGFNNPNLNPNLILNLALTLALT